MSINYIEINKNITVFKNLLNSTGEFYFSFYDENIELIDSTCPFTSSFKLFAESGCKTYIEEYTKHNVEPLIVWSSIGLTWICAFESERNQVKNIYVVGPIRNVETNFANSSKKLDEMEISIEDKREVLHFLKIIPATSTISLYPYAMMLNRCINAEPITRNDVHFQQRLIEDKIHNQVSSRSRSETWQAEQMLLSKVREGDLDYKETLERIISVETGVRIDTGDFLERAKLSVISFLTLCIKASIEGGLSPDVAYFLGENYMTSVSRECKSVGDIRKVFRTAYEDFIMRVRKNKDDIQLSPPIQITRDFIILNKESRINISELANVAGYTEYYLTRKFKSEMGQSINDYANSLKIEEAKKYLILSQKTIQEISDMLSFCSRSYFTRIFHKTTGTTPAEFRKSNISV